MYLYKFGLACLLAGTTMAESCFFSPSMKDSNAAKNLAYGLQNVTCPVNAGYTNLYGAHDVSSVLPNASSIVDTLKTTTVWLKTCDKIDNPNNMVFLRGPLLDIPFEFEQYVSNLVQYRVNIQKKGWTSELIDYLKQQKSAYGPFLNQVIDMIPEIQHDSFKQVLGPINADLDCAINAFGKSGSTISACPMTSTADFELPITTTGSNDAASTSSSAATGTTTTAPSITANDASATTTGAAGTVGFNMAAMLLGGLFAI